MNNYEKIKNMSLDEMAELLNNACHCIFNVSNNYYDFTSGLKQWLKQESEE